MVGGVTITRGSVLRAIITRNVESHCPRSLPWASSPILSASPSSFFWNLPFHSLNTSVVVSWIIQHIWAFKLDSLLEYVHNVHTFSPVYAWSVRMFFVLTIHTQLDICLPTMSLCSILGTYGPFFQAIVIYHVVSILSKWCQQKSLSRIWGLRARVSTILWWTGPLLYVGSTEELSTCLGEEGGAFSQTAEIWEMEICLQL